MDAAPFASFCFSTYKRPNYLYDTLLSVKNQTFADFEVIVCDNDTAESGRDAVQKINDPRFQYSANGENLGMKKSFNRSLSQARGKYVVMIADDDPVYPAMLQTLFDLQNEFPGFGMYLGGCDWFCKNHEIGKLYNFKVGTNSCLSGDHDLDYKSTYSPEEFLRQLYSFGIFPHYLWSTAIVKRELLLSKGGVPEYGTPFLGDYAYLSVIGAQSGCAVINRSLGQQTLHDENFGRDQSEQIAIAAKNFPAYIDANASHLPGWPEIRGKMLRFTGLWVITHMAFLHEYFKKLGRKEPGLRKAEKEVFGVKYMRRYKFKYYLKKNFPSLHQWLVNLKSRFSSSNK